MTLTPFSINNALERLDIPLPISEVHGLCCGLLCSMPSAAAKTRWFTELLDAASLSADAVSSKAAELKTLDEWFSESLALLNHADLEFAPHVPEDEMPVAVRIRALGDFCGGFTYGIGIALSQRGQKPLPKDTREIIEDFQAIEATDADDRGGEEDPTTEPQQSVVDTDEQREAMYFELLEYVRVGVLLVLEELRPVTPNTQEKPS